MNRSAVPVALALLLGFPAKAQEPPGSVRPLTLIGEEPRGAEMAPASRVFEIRDGALWLDGRRLPPEAIPPGIDLSGMVAFMELMGPVTPVVEVDGEPFVFENEQLVPFGASEKAGNVYIMGESIVVPSAAPEERLEPVVDEVYRRRLSEEDQALYRKLEMEAQLEHEIAALAHRVRGLPPGDEYNSLTADLRQRLGSLFDLKQELRAEELRQAESELRALKAILAERTSMRDQIIEHRVLTLLGETSLER